MRMDSNFYDKFLQIILGILVLFLSDVGRSGICPCFLSIYVQVFSLNSGPVFLQILAQFFFKFWPSFFFKFWPSFSSNSGPVFLQILAQFFFKFWPSFSSNSGPVFLQIDWLIPIKPNQINQKISSINQQFQKEKSITILFIIFSPNPHRIIIKKNMKMTFENWIKLTRSRFPFLLKSKSKALFCWYVAAGEVRRTCETFVKLLSRTLVLLWLVN
jgi:hypothetical protein